VTIDNMTPGDQPPGRDNAHCGARNRGARGGTCARPAGWGTSHVGTGSCKLHGGSTPNHQIAAERVQVAELAAAYSIPREVHPLTGVIEQYHRYAGQVAFLEERVNALPEEALFWGLESETDRRSPDGEEGERLRTGAAAEFERRSKAGPNALLEQFDRVQREYAKLGIDIVRIGVETAAAALKDKFGSQLSAVMVSANERKVALVRSALGCSDEQARALAVGFGEIDVEAIATFAGASRMEVAA
jgi:hypothetical protein